MPRPTKRSSAKTRSSPEARKAPAPRRPKGSPEYMDYLERYEEFGEGRPRLSPKHFDKLDDELLELLDLRAEGHELSDDQQVRIEELEYLLIEPE